MSLIAPELKIDIASFAPGFLDTPEEDSLAVGATRDAKNAMFFSVQVGLVQRAILRKRKGSRLINPIPIASGKAVDGSFWWQRENGADELIVVCNGTAYKWDGGTGFAALTGGGGFTAGNRVNFLAFKNNLFLMDGAQQLRYDGTSCKAVGFVAPTAAPALATAAGPGVTGTYEGIAVWYDSTMDHESSPSAVSAAVVFANQKRQWTKPAGAPPANVDFWRIYCRRTDTNENNYFLVATVAIGTGSVTESVSDDARRDIGPAPGVNDVPTVYALAEEYKGYRIGVPANSSDAYVSRQLDPESQHPKDKFPIGGKGDTKPVRAVRKYGTDCLLQKPTRTYRLVGDTVPFKIEPIDGSLGGVSQKSGVEVNGWWYQWDDIKGPYRTDLETWEPLVDARIENVFATINRQALHLIEAAHYRTLSLIVWAVPTSSTRRRTLLKYNYKLDVWLPPDTGFEYATLTEFTTAAGAYGVYFGDEWGRVYELYSGEVDGVPSGTLTAAITAATAGTITAAAAAFFSTGAGLAGMPVLVVSPSGATQWVRAQSNTGTVITLDTINGPSLVPVPVAGWTVIVGGIDWYWWTPRLTGGDPMTAKAAGWFYLQGAASAATHQLHLDVRFNRALAVEAMYTFTFDAGGLVWGSGVWGTDAWGAAGTRSARKHRMPRSYYDAAFRFWNYLPNQPIQVTWFRLTGDWLRRRQVKSA